MNKDKVKALEAIYAKVPKIVCRGLCGNSCGLIPMTVLEAKRIEKKVHLKQASDDNLHCNLLNLGRCTVYDLRPMICRLYAVVESMPCDWGCKPERFLTHEEGHALLREVEKLSPLRGIDIIQGDL